MAHRRIWVALGALAAVASPLVAAAYQQKSSNGGFQDTPLLPGGRWHVHDGLRPQPPVVQPGVTGTPQAPGQPPSDATVLFDGKDASQWRTSDGKPVGWLVRDGSLVVPPPKTPGGGMIYSRAEFGDAQIHLEFRTPTPATGSSQGRGNSGLLIMGRYEVQILDCFENPTYADGTIGAVYGQTPPLANASRPPGEWQTLDVAFTAPRFNDDKTVATPAYLTVLVNGILVQNHTASLGPVQYRKVATYEHHKDREALALQDHNNPVEFRNIWVRPLRSVEQP